VGAALMCTMGGLVWAQLDAVVTYVGDGDTLYVQSAQEPGRQRAVRLVGIDAPEICQDGGAAAREALQARVLGQPVQLLQRGTDDYGRELAVVTWRGQDLGRWLVEQGLAWSSAVGTQPSPYAMEQSQARDQKRGLFAQSSPEPPWRFRRRHGSCRSLP
jgi:endonuclease YncB( thermonuclease family)